MPTSMGRGGTEKVGDQTLSFRTQPSMPGGVVEVKDTGGKPLQLWQNSDRSVPWDQWA